MNAEQLQLMIDVFEISDQKLSKKLKVPQKDVVEWRTDQLNIPGSVVVAIDHIFGNGKNGSALAATLQNLEQEWIGFVDDLSIDNLINISNNARSVEYAKGTFDLKYYSQDDDNFHIYDAFCEDLDSTNYCGNSVSDFLSNDIKEEYAEGDYPENLKKLVAEAERSKMFKYRSYLPEKTLQKIYDNNMRNMIDREAKLSLY